MPLPGEAAGPYPPRGHRTFLCAKRMEAGITQMDLAHRAGVDQSSISLWESGAQFLSYDRAEQLSKFLPVRPSKLYGIHNADAVQMFLANLTPDEPIPEKLGLSMVGRLRAVILTPQARFSEGTMKHLSAVYNQLLRHTLYSASEHTSAEDLRANHPKTGGRKLRDTQSRVR